MRMANLIDKLFLNQESQNDRSLFEVLDDDAVQNHLIEGGYDPSSDPARLALRVPEILPCAFDSTVQFWLKRIKFWGRLNVKYIDIDGRKHNATAADFEEAMTQPDELIKVFGKWWMKKLSLKSFEASREFTDQSGKKRKETYIVDIELDDDIKKGFQGKI
jgi:hypothetical protein